MTAMGITPFCGLRMLGVQRASSEKADPSCAGYCIQSTSRLRNARDRKHLPQRGLTRLPLPGPRASSFWSSRPGHPSWAACAPWPTRSAPRTSAASAAAPSHAVPRPGSSWGPGLAPANIFKCYNYFCRHGIILLQFGLKLVLECTLTRLFTTAIKMQRFPSGIILRHFE